MHLEGLEHGAFFPALARMLEAEALNGLTGAEIELSCPSVGATENLMLAGVVAKGETTISNAAREPEVVDLAEQLNAMGASVEGAGTRSFTSPVLPNYLRLNTQ